MASRPFVRLWNQWGPCAAVLVTAATWGDWLVQSTGVAKGSLQAALHPMDIASPSHAAQFSAYFVSSRCAGTMYIGVSIVSNELYWTRHAGAEYGCDMCYSMCCCALKEATEISIATPAACELCLYKSRSVHILPMGYSGLV